MEQLLEPHGEPGAELADDAWPSVAATIGSIQPHPEVPAALDRLRNGGWTLVALTNSGQATVEAQCEGADLTRRFDHILSVDRVRTFKPAPAPYRLAAETVGADPSDLWMVACHDWDLAGARAVGLRTAYVRRTGMAYARTYPAPDLDVWDFGALADHLLGGR
ncbi:MAG: HAD-IA family hydrolase [Actinomycetota bacterium]